jgi:hypothetical protein
MNPLAAINWLTWKLYREQRAIEIAKLDAEAALNRSYPILQNLGCSQPGARRAFLSFVVEPFLPSYTEAFGRSHANYWLVQAMVDELGRQGYSVDLTDWRHRHVPSSDNYDIILGQGAAFEACAAQGTSQCPKIYFGWGLHAGVTARFVHERVKDIKERRGLVINQTHPQDDGPRVATEVWSFGTEYVFDTYRAISSVPVFELPNPIVAGVERPRSGKNFELARTRFMWMAAYGTLRRSLDLLLEIFESMPALSLTICGGIEHERTFFAAYKKQLLETPNIHYEGWLDVAGQRYHDITHECGWMIYPSVSDGMPGSMVNAMAEGVVPIFSDGAGIDTGGHGIHLNEISIEAIRSAILTAASIEPSKLASESASVSSFAWQRYSQDAFRAAFKSRLCLTLSERE